MSAIYYALFHFICSECADQLVGASPASKKQRAWYQVYRALDHTPLKKRCKTISKENHVLNFPNSIKDLSGLLVSLQAKRHEADYDPLATITALDCATYVADVRAAMLKFSRASVKHRKAFATYVLVNHRQMEKD